MAKDIRDAFLRSRRTLVPDAAGVLALGLLLIGALRLAAVY